MIEKLHTSTDFHVATREHTPLGKVCIYLYDEGANAHGDLWRVFDRISREAEHSKFYAVNMDLCDEEAQHKFDVISFPVFLVLKDGELLQKMEISTKEGLVRGMKRCRVIEESKEINIAY